MAAHGSRVAFCTARAAEACRAEGLALVEADTCIVADAADGEADVALLHGATSYLSMLHDQGRNEAYEAALRAAAPSRLVLDLGAGTGLLALLSCRVQPESHAVACEVYGPMTELAQKIVHENGFSARLKVVNKLASDLEVGPGLDLPERADLCVFELFDSQLFGESIVPILRDAHARLLAPGATLVPRGVRINAALVEATGALSAADLPELRGAAWPLMLGQMGASATRRLSASFAAGSLDFAALPPPEPRAEEVEVEVTDQGTVHGVLWWWELDMGGGGTLSSWSSAVSSSSEIPARHHWRPCLSFLEPRAVRRGERLRLKACQDDEAAWFAWSCPEVPVPPRWVEGAVGVPPERERLVMAATSSWSGPLCEATAAAAATAGAASGGGGARVLLLPAEDALLLPRLAAAAATPGGDVSAVLPSRAARRVRSRGCVAAEVELATVAEYLQRRQRFNVIVAEPFDMGDVMPWTLAMNCKKRLSEVADMTSSKTCVLPRSAKLVVVLVECSSVWLARRPLTSICGLRMETANASLVPSREAPLDCNLCELAWRPLSAQHEVMSLDLAVHSSADYQGSCELQPTSDGTCHGVALWTDFDFGSASLSTGPPSHGEAPTGWSQALQLLAVPLQARRSGAAIRVDAELASNGEFRLRIGGACPRDAASPPDAAARLDGGDACQLAPPTKRLRGGEL
eukprot:TRINITY_DN10004_c0_g2_i1.p1 TRINITY_DN10004_c0_g2~~TRINITY_DN10004_c0_g2_i1.p1  ORF type:complete len:691 (+),score=141.47 TRINITY_DN10004_c0_g2_i1:86-2158(+)